MDIPTNLVSDSSLLQETVELIQQRGGRLSTGEIAQSVFRLAHADPKLTDALVADLIHNDRRFRINGSEVELLTDNTEAGPLDEHEFVVLDVEAARPKHFPARVIELGAYRVRSCEIVDHFETLVNPGFAVPSFITSLTGITSAMLKQAPAFSQIAQSWLAFAGDATLVAHNTTFDLPLLNQEIARVFPGYRLRNSELCTVILARRVVPQLEGHNLDSLMDHFGIHVENRHRAAADARATAQLLIRLLEQLRGQGVVTLAEARRFSVFENAQRRNDVELALDV